MNSAHPNATDIDLGDQHQQKPTKTNKNQQKTGTIFMFAQEQSTPVYIVLIVDASASSLLHLNVVSEQLLVSTLVDRRSRGDIRRRHRQSFEFVKL